VSASKTSRREIAAVRNALLDAFIAKAVPVPISIGIMDKLVPHESDCPPPSVTASIRTREQEPEHGRLSAWDSRLLPTTDLFIGIEISLPDDLQKNAVWLIQSTSMWQILRVVQ